MPDHDRLAQNVTVVAEEEGIRERLPQGSRIFEQGDHGSHAYVIDSGRVEISFQRDNSVVPVAVLGPGDIFGEMALIDDRPRSATAMALTDVELFLVDRHQIQRALRESDTTMRLLLEVLLGRFRAMQGRMHWTEDSAVEPPPEDTGGDSAESHRAAIDRLKLEQELRQALNADALGLVLQPIVGLDTGWVEGFEALLRWHHAERGAIPTSDFIRMAESADLIREVDRWVCRHAIATLREIQDALSGDRPPPFVSINLSAVSLDDDLLVPDLRSMLSAAGLGTESLRFEITEGVLISNPTKASKALDDLANEGIQVALDDFGTGYSSLSYLVGFPIRALKIDRAFVTGMSDNTGSQEIIRAIVGMAKALDMRVVAEGVERSPELEALWRMNCDSAQGFLLGRPMGREQAARVAGHGPILHWGPKIADVDS